MYCEKPETSKRIVILVRKLDQGGAQRQLITLALELKALGRDVHVVSFYPGGAFAAELGKRHSVPTYVLGKHGRWDTIGFLIRLINCLRHLQPDVVYSFMDVPNILMVILKPLLTGTRVAWGVRASNMDLSRDWFSRLAYWLECRLAHFADCIIANSHAGKRYAVANGFPENKMVVIPNGIDTNYFRFDLVARQRVRSAWGVSENEILVGLVARLDPMKDHPTFLKAASRIAHERHNVRFVCVGDGPAAYAETLKQQAAALGLTNQLIWAGARDDMPAIYSALDIVSSSSSYGEGFSNTIAEAMACGTPCVVTDVGDSAWIVEGTGVVVLHSDPEALAQGILKMVTMLAEQRRALGGQTRSRIVAEFGLDNLVQTTERALGTLEGAIKKC